MFFDIWFEAPVLITVEQARCDRPRCKLNRINACFLLSSHLIMQGFNYDFKCGEAAAGVAIESAWKDQVKRSLTYAGIMVRIISIFCALCQALDVTERRCYPMGTMDRISANCSYEKS